MTNYPSQNDCRGMPKAGARPLRNSARAERSNVSVVERFPLRETSCGDAAHATQGREGFALVVSLSLMAFILLLLMSLSTLVRVETVSAAGSLLQLEARQNARLGAFVALGELQRHAGRDTVATAPATVWDPTSDRTLFLNQVTETNPTKSERLNREIDFREWWNEREPRWTGVWSSETPGALPVWLVSGNEGKAPAPSDNSYRADYQTPDEELKDKDSVLVANVYPEGFPSDSDGKFVEKILLADPSNADPPADDYVDVVRLKREVRVPRVEFDGSGSGGLQDAYAFWVSDESTKASVSIQSEDLPLGESSISLQSDHSARVLRNPERRNLNLLGGTDSLQSSTGWGTGDFSKALRRIPYGTEELFYLASAPEASIIASSGHLHELTNLSMGLLTSADPRDEGLRRNLTRYLEDGPVPGRIADNDLIAPAEHYDPSTFTNVSGEPAVYADSDAFPNDTDPEFLPRWGVIREWYQTTGNASPISPKPRRDDTFGVFPVMSHLRMGFGFSYDSGGRLLLHITPVVGLWNPYDVPIEETQYHVQIGWQPAFTNIRVASTSGTHQFSGYDEKGGLFLHTFSEVGGATPGVRSRSANHGGVEPAGGGQAGSHPTRADVSLRNLSEPEWREDGNNFEGGLVLTIDTDFQPGEVLIFSVDFEEDYESGIEMVNGYPEIPGSYVIDTGISINPVPDDASALILFMPGEADGFNRLDPLHNDEVIKRLFGFSLFLDSEDIPLYNNNMAKYDHKDTLENYGGKHSLPSRNEADQPKKKNRDPGTFDPDKPDSFANQNWLSFYSFSDYPLEADTNTASIQSAMQAATDESSLENMNGEHMDGNKDAPPYRPMASLSLAATDPSYSPIHGWVQRFPGLQAGYPDRQDIQTVLGTPWDWNANKMGGIDPNARTVGKLFTARYNGSNEEIRYPVHHLRDADEELHSLAELQHVPLARHVYQPAFPIGNAYADLQVDRGKIVGSTIERESTQGSNDGQTKDFPNDSKNRLVDLSYLMNDALWDRYFLLGAESGTELINNPEKAALWSISDAGRENPSLIDDFDNGAAQLYRKGSFNVNSTSVEAWKALLGANLGIEHATGVNDANPEGTAPMLRSLNPMGAYVPFADDDEPFTKKDQIRGPTESYGVMFTGGRFLTETQIEELAVRIVDEIRHRGPFLRLSDFVNRKLIELDHLEKRNGYDPYPYLQGISGAIARAIDLSGINGGTNTPKEVQDKLADPPWDREQAFAAAVNNAKNQPYFGFEPGGPHPNSNFLYYFDEEHTGGVPVGERSVNFAHTPGMVSQADVLSAIGSVLTTRGDTFKIRAYGEASDLDGTPQKAWIEATVQRVYEPVEARPGDPYSPEPDSLGRRFIILSYRYLNQSEI